MRDEDRIDRIIEALRKHWHENPDQRFWQIIMNAHYHLYDENMKIQDPYYVEDDEFETVMNAYYGGESD